MDHTSLDQVSTLHTAAVDARNGYAEALHDAEGEGLTPLFRAMIALHGEHAVQLATALRHLGQEPGDTGSFMSTVNRTIMGVRSLFGGLGDGVLPGLIDGEGRNLAHYDEVLASPDMPVLMRDLLTTQRAQIELAILEMRGLHDRI